MMGSSKARADESARDLNLSKYGSAMIKIGKLNHRI